MKQHSVRTFKSADHLPRAGQLAWKIAEVAADPVAVENDVVEMLGNRIIDNAAVAAASVARRPVASARAQAEAHPFQPGATVFGLARSQRISPEWAAWANGVAVRELDFHDTFLAADYSHPGDNIPPVLAVAQHCGLTGADLVRGSATGLRNPGRSREGHLPARAQDRPHRPSRPVRRRRDRRAARLACRDDLSGRQQALHVTTTTRQSRKGEISSWKAYAPAFAGKMAIEAVDRAHARRRRARRPIYEGEDGFIAWLLGGPDAEYTVPLPEQGEPKRAILDTYTKEHSAEYQSQALIDLARRLRPKIGDLSKIESIVIHTSHHTHYVIGTGANDPQKMDPKASRETLDHSIMYIFAVALEDGGWHHERSYAPERAGRATTIALWRKISHGRRPRMDPPLPQPRSEGKSVRRPRHREAEGRLRHQRRNCAGRRTSARRPPVQADGLHPEIPQPGGRRNQRG